MDVLNSKWYSVPKSRLRIIPKPIENYKTYGGKTSLEVSILQRR